MSTQPDDATVPGDGPPSDVDNAVAEAALARSGPRRMTRRTVLGAVGVAGALAAGEVAVAQRGHASAETERERIGSPHQTLSRTARVAPPPTHPGQPRRSDEMAAMIGVVVHLTGDPTTTPGDRRSDYLYSRFRDKGPGGGAGWIGLLANAGIRHARCDTGSGIAPGTTPAQMFALDTMRLLDHVKPAHSPPYVTGIDKVFLSSATLAADLPVLRAGAGRLWMIEGPDEAWPPNGKFLPSYVSDGSTTYMCLHAMARRRATPPLTDPARWQPCRQRGPYNPTEVYEPGDLVVFEGHTWVAPPTYFANAGTAPGPGWWDLTAWSMPEPFSTNEPGIYYGYSQAGELGVAWGEYMADLMASDNAISGGYWDHSGAGGGPTRVTTWSEGGMDVYFFWSPHNDASLLGRYQSSMPGGATNVHEYAGGQPTDVAAVTGACVAQAQAVLPGYAVYVGEIGQATYPTDDALALGRRVDGATPRQLLPGSTALVPVDENGRPMPGAATGRFGAEAAQAQTIARAWAEMFRLAPAGSRLAVYELLNEPFSGYGDYTGTWGYPPTGGPWYDYNRSEGNFGLLRSDLSAKPAFTAIRNTCQLMGDTGDQEFVPRELLYTVDRDAAPQPSAMAQYGAFCEVQSVLTQGSDGVFRIPVWYVNVRATQELLPGASLNSMVQPPPSEVLTLTLPWATPARLEAYNTQVSGAQPVVALVGSHRISWTHTADLWIIKVYMTT
jgi:hypothetical protein